MQLDLTKILFRGEEIPRPDIFDVLSHQCGVEEACFEVKEIYLLSGLIFCGECGHALQGNHRPAYMNRPKYVTYRCGNRDRTKQCDNKEIRREYVEMYVLHQLAQRLFNDSAIPHLVQMLNEYQQKSNTSINKELT